MYQLRPEYQQQAHDETIAHCKQSNEPAYHDHSVGAGKSINIAFMAKHVADCGGRVLMLARQGELVEQNADDYFAIGGKCSIFSASLGKRSTYYPVIFGTEGTVCRALDQEFKRTQNPTRQDKCWFDCLLVDENHMVDIEDVVLEEPETQYGKIINHFRDINPKMRVIGYTGSPYRGKQPIKNGFWKRQLSQVTTYQLINLGYLVPPVFGFGDDDHHYDLSKWSPQGGEGAHDYTSKELAAMGRQICNDKTKTQAIIEEVVERTKDRLGVLITCASKKHCEQVSEFLPEGSWGIVTDATSTKERRRILSAAKSGEIKYVMQIGCLTTGINIPRWDCCVILRRIGSLTLLIQLCGRVLRTLKPEQIDHGLSKTDALILDYTDTFESMGDIYDDPIVQSALTQKSQQQHDTVTCPRCEAENSPYAIRCIGTDEQYEDGRCEYFFKSKECGQCQALNAPSAKNCRKCNAILIDPNDQLVNKAYTDADYKPVKRMVVSYTKTGKVSVIFELDSVRIIDGKEIPENAKEYFDVSGKLPHEKGRWYKFVTDHIQGKVFQQAMMKCRTVEAVLRNKAMFDCPVEITHRVNEKGFSIINRKRFRSGREEKAG